VGTFQGIYYPGEASKRREIGSRGKVLLGENCLSGDEVKSGMESIWKGGTELRKVLIKNQVEIRVELSPELFSSEKEEGKTGGKISGRLLYRNKIPRYKRSSP